MRRKVVFFFRGLSTHGRDNVVFAGLDLGPFHSGLEKELKDSGFEFVPVLGMRVGTLEQVADRAIAVVESHDVWKDSNAEVGFFGHSTGGLIARLVLNRLHESKRPLVTRCLTVATPNQGSRLAELVCGMPKTSPATFHMLRMTGYDVRRDHDYFAQLLRDNVESVFRKYESTAADLKTDFASIICWAPRNKWCWPLRLAYKTFPLLKEFNGDSDGFLEKETQSHGRVLGEVEIDHIREIGLFSDNGQFEKLCQMIRGYF